jgi:hypothetical protein
MKRNVDGIAFWQQHLEGWRTSGLTQEEYCRQHGLKFTTLARYRNRINRERKASFVPVSIKAETAQERLPGAVEIRLHNGRVLALAGAFDETQLGQLIRLLEALPC